MSEWLTHRRAASARPLALVCLRRRQACTDVTTVLETSGIGVKLSFEALEGTSPQTVGRRLAEFLLVLRPRDYVTELVSGPLACELPLYGNPVAIHATVPAPSLLAQASDVSDSAFS